MPSGSKKRKANKKKLENESNNHPNPSADATHSHGGDDVKHQDGKESDVGEVSSPASQDHHSHQNLLTEEEEEEIDKGKRNSNHPSVEGVKIEVGDKADIVVGEENVVQVEREFKIEGESDKTDEMFEHDEKARKSYDGGSSGSSSSSSSSDDESHGKKSSHAVVDIAPVVDSVEVTDSLSERKAQAINNATIEEAGNSVVENIPAFVTDKISLLGETAAGNSGVPSIVESVFKENEEKKLSHVEDKVEISAGPEGAASQQKDEAIIPSIENIAAVSDPKECIAQETDDLVILSYNAPIASADNGTDREKDAGVNEPLLAPVPHPAQRTSWKSCCGLFEVFSQSG